MIAYLCTIYMDMYICTVNMIVYIVKQPEINQVNTYHEASMKTHGQIMCTVNMIVYTCIVWI